MGQLQAQDTWCWAAAAASIERFYVKKEGDYLASRPQCAYVGWQHQREACRQRKSKSYLPFHEDCQNRGCSIFRDEEEGRLDFALMRKTSRLRNVNAQLSDPNRDYTNLFEKSEQFPASFQKIASEIERENPVAIRIERADGTHHLLVIFGYDRMVPSLTIWDPSFGERRIAYNKIQVRLGTWTHTIFTNDWWENAIKKWGAQENSNR